MMRLRRRKRKMEKKQRRDDPELSQKNKTPRRLDFWANQTGAL